MCGESGTSHTELVHHYYKCVNAKKAKTCKKKTVKKQWIEDLVIDETMKMVWDDKAIEAIVQMALSLQELQNTNLPLYEQQLQETNAGIRHLLDAIQQGILTKSTKGRLEELENAKEDLEVKIANEKLAKPKADPDFLRFFLKRFRRLDVTRLEQRKMLVDVFVNSIYLYDDKMVITFNYKEGTKTITFNDVKKALSKRTNGSDLDCSGAPNFDKFRYRGLSKFLY